MPVDRDGQPGKTMVAVEEGSANVYADLGRPDADKMLVKAQLASRIGEVIKRRRLTQVAAARITSLPQPKLSGLLRGQFRGISEAKMLACLTRLGRDVRVVVGPARRQAGRGRAALRCCLARAPRRRGPRRTQPGPALAGAGGSFYLTRTDGGRALFLYDWDDTQSAWGPDRTKAHRFASAPAAIDMAVRCGGPNDGPAPITIAED